MVCKSNGSAMHFTTRSGVIGVVLAVCLGVWLDSVLPAGKPGMEDLAIHAGALFLGLYALTVDRCEVPGLLPSYRANLQNFFAAVSETGMGTYDKPVVPGRRLSFFVLPIVIIPWILLLIGVGHAGYALGTTGTLSRLDRFRDLELPLASIAIWSCYALATQSLRLRTKPGVRESAHF
jgi:hypothetical protein